MRGESALSVGEDRVAIGSQESGVGDQERRVRSLESDIGKWVRSRRPERSEGEPTRTRTLFPSAVYSLRRHESPSPLTNEMNRIIPTTTAANTATRNPVATGLDSWACTLSTSRTA